MINATTMTLLDDDVPRRPSYGVYISQLVRFATVCIHVDDLRAYASNVSAHNVRAYEGKPLRMCRIVL